MARGQGLVEYGLIAALTALMTIAILVLFGGTLAEVLQLIGDAIDVAT
jgi:Flp pilus assembly pilin Flp